MIMIERKIRRENVLPRVLEYCNTIDLYENLEK